MKRLGLATLALAALAAACASSGPPGDGRCAESTAADQTPLARPLTEDDVLCAIRDRRPEVDACREAQRAHDPTLEGMATVAFVWLPSGRTSSVTITPAPMAAAPLGRCLLDAVQKWTFRPYTGLPKPIDFPVPLRRK